MDKIDHFIIFYREKSKSPEEDQCDGQFIIDFADLPRDIQEKSIEFDYIESLIRKLSRNYPSFKFTFEIASKINPELIWGEFDYQKRIYRANNPNFKL